MDLKSKPVLFTIAWALQAICLALLLSSMSTFEYKINKDTDIGFGQYMICPLNGDPGCGNSPSLTMVTVSKFASAIQAVSSMGVMGYLSLFALLHYLKKVEIYLSNEAQKNVYFGVILLAFISLMGGMFGPILTTWCYEEELPQLHFGYSMHLHWIQLPFSFVSMLIVVFAPLLEASKYKPEDYNVI